MLNVIVLLDTAGVTLAFAVGVAIAVCVVCVEVLMSVLTLQTAAFGSFWASNRCGNAAGAEFVVAAALTDPWLTDDGCQSASIF